MVQDKDKLKEVGLEPDKPAGHIRAIWALTLILAFAMVIVGGVYFILWYSPWGEDASWHRSGKTSDTSDWQKYTNWNYIISVEYPQNWGYKEFSVKSKDASILTAQLMVSFYVQDKESQVKSSTAIDIDSVPGDIFLLVESDKTIDQVLAGLVGCQASDKTIAEKQGKYVTCTNGDKESWYYLVSKSSGGNTYELFTKDETKKDTLDKMIGTWSFGAAGKSSPSSSPSASSSPSPSRSSSPTLSPSSS